MKGALFMKKYFITFALIFLSIISLSAGEFEFIIGGGASTFGLRDLKDEYESANHDFGPGVNLISHDTFDENISGKSYLIEVYYGYSPNLRVGMGCSRLVMENHAKYTFSSPVISGVFLKYNDEIKYDLFYLSAKYNVFKALYAGLRLGWGTAIYHDYYDLYEYMTYVPSEFSRQEYDTNGFLLMSSVGLEKNMWRCFNLGIEAGYRHLDMKDIEHYYPNQVDGDPEWKSTTIDLDSSGFFLNMFVVIKM